MAEPIEMPFGLRTRVGLWKHVLDGGPDPRWEGEKLGEENGRPIVKSSVQRWLNGYGCRLGCGFRYS